MRQDITSSIWFLGLNEKGSWGRTKFNGSGLGFMEVESISWEYILFDWLLQITQDKSNKPNKNNIHFLEFIHAIHHEHT